MMHDEPLENIVVQLKQLSSNLDEFYHSSQQHGTEPDMARDRG